MSPFPPFASCNSSLREKRLARPHVSLRSPQSRLPPSCLLSLPLLYLCNSSDLKQQLHSLFVWQSTNLDHQAFYIDFTLSGTQRLKSFTHIENKKHNQTPLWVEIGWSVLQAGLTMKQVSERLHEEASAFYSGMKRQLESVQFCSQTVHVTRLCFTPSLWAAELIFSVFICVIYWFPGMEQDILKYRSFKKNIKTKKDFVFLLHLHNHVCF